MEMQETYQNYKREKTRVNGASQKGVKDKGKRTNRNIITLENRGKKKQILPLRTLLFPFLLLSFSILLRDHFCFGVQRR